MKLEVFKSSYGYYNLRTIDGKPTEEMSNYLKQNGYYWSRNNNCWYPGTSAAKNTEANKKFVEDFRKKFFEPAEQEQKSFGQELFEREQRKTAWREAHGLETKQEHSEENISNDERITYLETLINELREERKRDQEKIARLEFELANNRDEGLADFYSQQEQQQLDDEAEWEKENTLTEEEEKAIIDEHNEIPSEIILDSSEAINTIGEIMKEAAREEEPQAENDFMESSSNEEDPEVEVSPEELSLAKSVLPTSQYVSTLRFSQGEEGNFFKQKLKEIAEVVNKAPKLYETDGAEQHPIVLRYFHPTGTETLVTKIGEDGEAYGFQCLNGDYEMAEWGYLDLNEIKSIRMMEIDYHVEKGMTVERWLYKEQPDMFPQYAKFAEQLEEKFPMDIANETGNDVEAIAKALNNQNENEIIVDSQQLADELFDKVTNRYYEENKDFFDTYEKVKEAHIENESRYVGDARIRHNFEQYHEELVKMQLQELTDIIKEADSQEIASKAATRYFNAFGADRYSYYGSLYSITKLAHYESGKLIYPTPEELQSFIKETYNDLHGIVEEKEQENVSNKPFNFFINDAANLDLGIGAEIEPITGLTAEQAAVKYAELKDKGLSPYIGINIPGDFVFDDKEGQGAGIFTEVNGRPSFYMGDNFVKDLNEYDEHTKNVLAAYKELYEMTDKYILGVERPDFVFEKENEFSENKEYDFTKPINISERFAIDFVNHGYKENTVRFIDRKNNQITTGQYLVSTIADRKGNSELILDMGVSAWTVDAESMKKAEEICRYYRYNHITVTSRFEENVELEAENGERMTPEQLNQWNEEQKLQHSQDADLDDLAEGKKFSMEAAMQSVENDNKKMNFVLDKLAAAGIEVVSHKSEFDKILIQATLVQKMATSLSELNELNNSIKIQKENIDKENQISEQLAKDESIVNNNSFESFVSEMQKYQDIFPKNEFIKISDLDYEKSPSSNFALFIGKDYNEHIILSFDCKTPGHKHSFHTLAFFDITNNESIISDNLNNISYGNFDFRNIAINVLEETKEKLSQNDFIPQIQDTLKEILESLQSRQSDILDNLIKENESKKEILEEKIDKIKELEKKEARRTIDNWLNEAEENAEHLWFKEKEDVKAFFKNNDERKSIGIIPIEAMSIFEGIEDYHLYVDKSYLIYHYMNRHYDARLFENIQNVLDNYSEIYFDTEQNSICFEKKYGELADCLFVKNDNGRIVLFGSTYNMAEKRLHSDRYKKITPAKKQEQKVSLEGSTPLSQNPKGNTAAAISDLNDNSNISQNDDLSSIQEMVNDNGVYGFVYEDKIYLNPALAESETAIHEYTHLWDNYTQRTNPELWQKGKYIFKNTKFWADVKADPNYADIADNDDLLLSEVHAQICGKMADEVLNKILERDGELTRDTVIDWDKECWDYIASEIGFQAFDNIDPSLKITNEDLRSFLAQPMKDLMNGIQITRIAEKEIETEYKIMQEISKGLTPDEISLNLAKYKESLVYAQEKSKESWEDFYARNTTGFDTPQTVDEFRQAYEHNKKQFEYDVNKYTGWIKALEEVQPVATVSNSPKLTEEQKKEIYETHLKWQEFLNLTEPRIKQYGEAEMRKLSRENAKEFADEFIKAYELQDEDRLLRMNNAWGINPYTEGGFDDERDIPRTTFIKYFTDGQNISYESVKQGIIAHCKKQNIENTPVNETNAKLAANINWTEFTEDVFNKTKEDLKNWKDGEVYASINVGQLSFELVPQNMNDRMELFTNIYYPDLNATYGEDADGVRYDTASGFDIASETFIKMSYEEFKDYFANTVLPSSLDNELTERALTPTEDWNTIWEKLNEEKTVEPEQLTSKKDIKAIREQCREILKKPDSEITEADKVILAQYEGAGGLNEVNRTNAGILNEFYTPNNLVEKVWQIVDAYAPNAKTVLEPSAGVGKFANNRPNNEFTMHELDETSARINKILHPEANVIQGAYQKQFFDEGERVKLSSYQQPKYDVVIGNPPYGKYNDKYKGLGEGKEFDRYEEYFIDKGLDALKDENSLLAFVVPSGFLNTVNDKQKEIIASKGKLVDAYRLPVGAFPTTEVGTDIIIMKKDSAENRKNNQWAFNENSWFHMHPEKILGEVMIRTNRFGKEEEYVTVHEGLTLQDELNKIDSMLPNLDRQMSVENKQKNEQSNIPVENISKTFAEIYKDSPEKATESTQEFTEALEQMDFHKLGHFMLWGVAGGDEISEPVKAATRNIFENYTGKSFPVFENIDDETEKRHLTQLWLAKNTNVAHIDTWNKCYDLHSEQDVLEYLVSRGSGTQGGKERINKFFEKNSNDQERIKFLINEYGWFGSYDSVFEMQCNNNSKGIKVTAYITNPETEEVTKFDRMVSWKEICNEIKRQRLLEIYLDKPVEKTVSEENNKSQSKEVQQETTKTKTPRAKKEKWNIAKSKGEVMTAQEFSHLYGRDFDEREFPIWTATDWQGNIDLSKLSAEDLTYMEQSGNYVCKQLNKGEPEWTHKVLFTTGDIYAKIQEQRELLAELNTQVADDSTYETQKAIYEKNIALLEASKKEPLDMEHIHFGLKSTLAEEFTIPQFDGDGNEIEVNLQESFILWAQGQTLANRSNWRGYIDFATANISREELGEDISFSDIVQYIDGKPVKADAVRGWRTYRMTDEEKKAEKAERKKEADLKRQARADIANKLFDRYLHEGLEPETRKRLENEYNRRFNSYIIPDYSKLPLFVNGMSAYKGESKFKLYEQQIKGISFLCNKGNGLLAYDVGVGKTAAGIVATVNQIQTVRSKRPLIIVPNQVYSKWYTDIKQLFPNVKVNDLYNFNKQSVEKYIDSENPHKLNIPENSISLCTYEALKNITFTDESCENELYKDFANLLSADMDGSDRENAESSDKIKGIIGSASHVKDESYYFFEDCGFDHLTVDEAHNFKNLWVVPRPKKKGESNEYSGIPSGKPSARALKMYGMTQLVQEHNDNRNVFMLTATPFTNSPTEVYSMLSYIGRERLHQAGIPSLRSFFDQFAQTKQELGVTSNGEIDTKQVMKNWKELPALQNILTEFIDKVDGEEAGIVRPNKFTHVKPLDMSELQHQMREMDEERMAEVKEGNSAAVIVAMNNMRLSCVAPALANPDMYEGLELPPLSQLVETSPKLKFVCDAIIDMYKDNPEKGQFMYIPLGKESHGIIKDYLVQHGIPKEAVEIINGDINNSPEKKEKITSKFNDEKDKLKIIIGGKNTSEGIDLNGNSFVMYNCSLGWNPSETIQAEGRIWRQGNLQGNVHIVYPVMNDSIDSVLYQKHDEKRSRINELWNYKGDSLNVEEINPEDLKLDLIKDPQKKAKLILEEETKDIKSELSKINLKIKDFDEIIEKRKQLSFDFGTVEDNIERYEKMVNDYKDRNLEVPEWVKVTLKNYKKEQDKANYQKENIEKKLTAWNLETEEDEAAYINNLNSQKRDCEDKIAHIVETMPEILQKLEIERMEQKVMEYPVAKQREILESDILNNLRPMKEVEYEIKTERHNKMLAEMLKAGDITKEQHDLYKAAGYEKYEKWLNGEIDSLEEKPVEPSVQSENEQSREVEEKTPAVTDEYGFEVFGEEEPSHIEKTENVNSENKNTSDNSAHTNNSNNQSDNLGDLFSGVDNDDLYVKSPEQQYFNFDSDDKYLTPEQLTQAEQKRDEIILPILNGKESGMYNAFNTFAKKGLFDVVGTKIDIEEVPSGEPMISSTGWKQLQAAMNIYREKRFESFRYIFIDRENGEIRDQMAITCHMPNLCTASFDTSSEGTINKLIERAEQTNTMIVAVHNHPSGNTEPSYEDNCTTLKLDEELKTSNGKSLFAGHIILDHDTFSTWEPHRVNGWIQSDILEQKGKHDELLKDNFAFTGLSADNTSGLLSIADKINDVNNWNDDFIPVVFTNPQREVTGLKLYDKSFFNKEPQAIRNEFQFSGFEAGASSAFPVLTEDFMNKLGGADRFMFEEKMKDLVLHNAFTDAALPDSTIVQKYDIHAGMSFFTSHDLNRAIPDVKTTWEHRVNPTLYEQLKMGTLKVIQNEELENKPQQDLSHLKKASGMGY